MERGGMAFDVLFRLLSGGPKRNQKVLSERMSWSADHDLNPGSPEYETEILPLLRLWVRTHFNSQCCGALTVRALTSGILVTPSFWMLSVNMIRFTCVYIGGL
jgi:hypothetical protein